MNYVHGAVAGADQTHLLSCHFLVTLQLDGFKGLVLTSEIVVDVSVLFETPLQVPRFPLSLTEHQRKLRAQAGAPTTWRQLHWPGSLNDRVEQKVCQLI